MIPQGFNRKEKRKFKLSYTRPWEYALSAAVVADCYSVNNICGSVKSKERISTAEPSPGV
jgi:hypothetical protein